MQYTVPEEISFFYFCVAPDTSKLPHLRDKKEINAELPMTDNHVSENLGPHVWTTLD